MGKRQEGVDKVEGTGGGTKEGKEGKLKWRDGEEGKDGCPLWKIFCGRPW